MKTFEAFTAETEREMSNGWTRSNLYAGNKCVATIEADPMHLRYILMSLNNPRFIAEIREAWISDQMGKSNARPWSEVKEELGLGV